MSAIEVSSLEKSYGQLKAVDGISFSVRKGEVFSLLGPSDAGTTTTIEILEDASSVYFENPSGGQKQKLGLALALVNNPELLFLDEPTTGLDPQARRNMWDVIRGLEKEGHTIMLTTHYLEEAEVLSDRVAIMNHGRII